MGSGDYIQSPFFLLNHKLQAPKLFKFQATSTKLQINPKFQYPMTKTSNRDSEQSIIFLKNLTVQQDWRIISSMFGISNLGHWNLFDIWNL
jgi:hypothetical protein